MKTILFLFIVTAPLIAKAQVDEFSWLTGTWKMKNKETYEVWKLNQDKKQMEGVSYRIKGTDTLVMETLKIRKMDDGFYYIPDVAGGQAEVHFKMTKHDDKSFISENPEHDFPKIIRYQLLSPISIKAEIEGGGKIISFLFDKVK